MKHEECLNLLHDFVDDLLAADDAAAVGLHVRDCSQCAEEIEQIRELKIRAASMPPEITPPDDPWPGIAERIENIPDEPPAHLSHGRTARIRPFVGVAWAAAALLAFVVLWPRTDEPDITIEPVFGILDAEYAALHSDGQDVLASHTVASTSNKNELATGMSVIDQAIQETREAMKQVGGTSEQIRRLTHGYKKKMDLLQHLVHSASGS